jgi:SM-20-related protein
VGPLRRDLGADSGEDRILSAVYYFYREPKAFFGGALRLYRLNLRPSTISAHTNDFIDVEPLQNSLVAFPSWTTHEVRPVSCPTGNFSDYRFALNCWFCRRI